LRDIEEICKKVKCIYVCARAEGKRKKTKQNKPYVSKEKEKHLTKEREEIKVRENSSI
jgi:hypothetical protein